MIRKIILGVLSVSFICAKVYGQNYFQGSRIGALANAGASISDLWNISGNPAGFTSIHSFSASIGYESRFLSKEFSTQSAIIGFPVKSNYFGLSFSSFGEQPYTETTSTLSYAKTFGPNFSAGLKFNYHTVSILDYGNVAAYTIEVGMQVKVFPELTLGTHIVNPTREKFGNELQNPLFTILRVGGRYNFSQRTFWVAEIEKTLSFAPVFKTAIEYGLLNALSLRGGVLTNPFRETAGLGLHTANFAMDLGAISHPTLGFSSQMNLAYAF
ncbi:hypothetical protein [Solitalea canadensis]|uniref:PorV/PorQ family protein n=1 Tax=Solitalea canadensis (strain ATCC 29591 / DSM 3403 / JCM 21819 / LMG 8368 / NBRC 15130 / NCIMB 12057 / USAM 9D) TaxID=929556 RepID=H8KQZ3_SOLCM|nr:hypothetical protein [Solitalea canadensis]AFD07139.1 hypothetical protein Solca_2085 [Solitalea canadensis DSM 3403]